MFTIAEIVAATHGRLIGINAGQVSAVSTDSRTVAAGELFVPLKGERFDGHNYLAEVAEKGISVALVAEGWLKAHQPPAGLSCIVVRDTLRALGDLALAYRSRFAIPVIGVTGSNGKTTTKEMLATILEQGAAGLKTAGNLNNLIGLPQMIFRLQSEHQWAVLEMGMSEPGEIDRLAEIAQPQTGIVLNALSAHLQSMGSVEAVAEAKGELLHRISDGGLAVINADDPRVARLHQNPSAGRISFGINRGEVRAREIETLGLDGQRFLLVTPSGEARLHLKACGQHNIYNALAAAAALQDRIDMATIARGLEAFVPYKGRFQQERLDNGVTLIDDSYNANPSSVKAALETVAQLTGPGRRIAVLGDMLELGAQEVEAHEGIGAVAGRSVDLLYLLGERMTNHGAAGARLANMPQEAIICCDSHEDIARRLQAILRSGDVVLIKGSRGMTMERVALELKQLTQNSTKG